MIPNHTGEPTNGLAFVPLSAGPGHPASNIAPGVFAPMGAALVFGTGEDGRTLIESFDISENERNQARALSMALTEILDKAGLDRRIALAALAEAGAHAVEPTAGRPKKAVAS